MLADVAVFIGGSLFEPHSFSFTSGLSLIHLHPAASRIGIAFNTTKILCAECNTPIAEVAGGSLIIKNKHHSQRHTSAFSIAELYNKFSI